jgi:quercetin dioxygenase-like cupin family protein
MRRTPLGAQPWQEVYPGVRRRTVSGERMTLSTYRFDPGGRFPKHSHAQEQVALVTEGSVTFASPAQTITLWAGDTLVIPPAVAHDATAGEQGALVISVVSPARQSADDYTVEE